VESTGSWNMSLILGLRYGALPSGVNRNMEHDSHCRPAIRSDTKCASMKFMFVCLFYSAVHRSNNYSIPC